MEAVYASFPRQYPLHRSPYTSNDERDAMSRTNIPKYYERKWWRDNIKAKYEFNRQRSNVDDTTLDEFMGWRRSKELLESVPVTRDITGHSLFQWKNALKHLRDHFITEMRNQTKYVCLRLESKMMMPADRWREVWQGDKVETPYQWVSLQFMARVEVLFERLIDRNPAHLQYELDRNDSFGISGTKTFIQEATDDVAKEVWFANHCFGDYMNFVQLIEVAMNNSVDDPYINRVMHLRNTRESIMAHIDELDPYRDSHPIESAIDWNSANVEDVLLQLPPMDTIYRDQLRTSTFDIDDPTRDAEAAFELWQTMPVEEDELGTDEEPEPQQIGMGNEWGLDDEL